MKNRRHYLTLYLATLILSAGILGCATAKDIREIVAQSNAAMIAGPPLDKAGAESSDVWKETVGQMDRIIAENPDQTTLVNHLRVRQAMLLTVYQQGNLAEQRWKLVEGDALTTERDRALYENWKGLVWWYKRAPNRNILDDIEKEQAKKFMGELDTSINTIESHELRVYLATLRAQMALKLDGSIDPLNAEQMVKLHADLTTHLEDYIRVFTPEERAWVQDNPNTDVADHLSLIDIRNRVWLRSLIKAFFEIANDYSQIARSFGVSEQPDWEPAWVRTLEFSQ
jgi:hypothetical protein